MVIINAPTHFSFPLFYYLLHIPSHLAAKAFAALTFVRVTPKASISSDFVEAHFHGGTYKDV